MSLENFKAHYDIVAGSFRYLLQNPRPNTFIPSKKLFRQSTVPSVASMFIA